MEVDILLPAKSNLPFLQWAMTAYLWELLRFGVRVFLVPPPFVHTKVLLVDGTWVLMGSANLDPRSLNLNFEFNVEVYDTLLGGRLEAELDVIVTRSRPVTLEEVDVAELGRPASRRSSQALLTLPVIVKSAQNRGRLPRGAPVPRGLTARPKVRPELFEILEPN